MKKVIWMTAALIVIAICWLCFCGYQWSWGAFAKLHDLKTAGLPGNAPQYAPETVEPVGNTPLSGKTILFLGSSVTYGAASQGISFADYIGVRNGCTVIKNAVSGTTLVDSGLDSYISRLKKIDSETTADLFVCQLSTNDATQKKELGTVSSAFERGSFDTKTVAGAIEYIISYAKERFGCPVAFYTNPQYNSVEYAAMVELLDTIQQKWDIPVINLWDDADFNAITLEQRGLYMADSIHPTKAGYLEWWTPYMEHVLCEVVRNEYGS